MLFLFTTAVALRIISVSTKELAVVMMMQYLWLFIVMLGGY